MNNVTGQFAPMQTRQTPPAAPSRAPMMSGSQLAVMVPVTRCVATWL
jgi:hypothetical protein